jgi:hypothetical protein
MDQALWSILVEDWRVTRESSHPTIH